MQNLPARHAPRAVRATLVVVLLAAPALLTGCWLFAAAAAPLDAERASILNMRASSAEAILESLPGAAS